ncbi:hypothetical protein ACF3N7_04080 [Cruoricaptor ignavus]|uniref:hypothetical protein n=1 Tax=Cruoricaptor ignavus TaxID=1118202 RepID=UPI00370D437D
MKKISTILCLLIFAAISAQSKIVVRETGTAKPIAGAQIKCGRTLLATTDENGVANFRTKCKKVDISAKGYDEDEALTDKMMEIALARTSEGTKGIKGIVLQDKSDPRALAILKKVNENYAQNSPNSLDSYTFKSYEKLSFDYDEDSIRAYQKQVDIKLDSLKDLPKKPEPKKANRFDSVQIMKMSAESQLFIWERAKEYLYSKKRGEKINILDNKVAGFQEPIYELIMARSNRTGQPKEIREENRSLYRFFLTDSIEIDGRKNFVIRFRHADYKMSRESRRFNGYIYVDAETFALKKIETNSKVKSEGTMVSIWKPINGKWFLEQEYAKMRAFGIDLNDEKKYNNPNKKFGVYAYLTVKNYDFETPIPAERENEFKGYTVEVKNSDGTLLEQYRTEPLTERESMAYDAAETLSKQYKIESRSRILTDLLRGRYRLGIVDFDLAKLAGYNLYEGFRLGIGAKLNEKFHRYISPDAYIAYGFKDRGFKYGVGADFRTTLEKNSIFRAEIYDDVSTAGKFSEEFWNFRMQLLNGGISFNNDRFYNYRGFKISYENDLLNSLSARIAVRHDKERAEFPYEFNNLGNKFDNTALKFTLKYAPNSKNIMTPSGKYTYSSDNPEYYFNIETGQKILGGDLSYTRIDLMTNHSFKTKIGTTGIRLFGGMSTGDVPIWHNFQMNGLGSGKPDKFKFNLTSYLGFATMESGKYYNDKLAGYYFQHEIPWYFKSFGRNTSNFNLIYRGTIGDMKHPEYHDFEFEQMNKLYQEVGLEWVGFLSTRFNLGFFYRLGHYQTDKFSENFAVQFKLKFLGY